MKATVKYLPVEGEKEKGDTFLHTIHGSYHVITGISQNSDNSKRLHFDKGSTVDSELMKKVRLFAVTRDISNDDEVWDATYSNYGRVVNHEGKTIIIVPKGQAMYETPIESCFKVLGPISPNATWVKDGDEIEVKSDFPSYYPIFYGNPKYPNGACGDDRIAENGEYLKVKCSQCNTYH